MNSLFGDLLKISSGLICRGTLVVLAAAHLSATAQNVADNSSAKSNFTLAVIADCQYAEQPDNGKRLYTLCPDKLQQAVAVLNAKMPDAVIHLGDFIDKDFKSFDRLLAITDKLEPPMYHVLGNHDFSVADEFKTQVVRKLSVPARYYAFDHFDWRFIALDGNDVSTYGWPENTAKHAENMALYHAKYSQQKRWNGALGDEQLVWLKQALDKATRENKKVVLLSHFPIFPVNMHNLWNAAAVLELIKPYKVVKAWFSGHNHDGHYGTTEGIHFVTFHAMLDTPDTAFSFVTFSPSQIVIKGQGRQPSMQLTIR
ncbi:metallophosphoesterase [Paraglaciecola aquimarina]|uniref:Metallophosphoesterase n=1 Tax=Paraglaciecola aquimarina TaxID=1235557 RepID=A0ABU3SSJ8_9ALTE|nr:metallophosphoesterase [Paraglaciecola aquimarina]MDU0352942.1 metallophosphoesterase [Paraglaciecola aquimarina]